MEQLQRLYNGQYLAVVTNLLVGGLLVVVMHWVVAESRWLPWYLALALVNALRAGLARTFLHHRQLTSDRNWHYWFLATLFVNGLLWGAASLLFYTPGDPVHEAYLVLLVTGMAAGSVGHLSFSPVALMLFQVPLAVPLIVRLLLEGSDSSVVLGILGTLLLIVLAIHSARFFRIWKAQQDLLEELKGRREQTRREELRFRTVVDNLGDALYLHDRQGRFIDVNNFACRTLGYSRKELLAMNVTDVELGVDQEALDGIWDQLVAGETLRIAGTHRRRDGSTFPVEVTLCLYPHKDQQLYMAVVRDISERVAAEEAQRENEKQLQAQYRAIPVPTYTWRYQDGDFVLCNANEAAITESTVEPDSLLGRTAAELYPHAPEIKQFLAQCYRDQQDLDRNIFTSDDEPRYLAAKFAFVPPDQVLMHAEDITLAKRNEHALALTRERLAEAQRIARLGYWSLDEGDDILDCSGEVYDILGLSWGRSVISLNILKSLLEEQDRSALDKSLELAKRRGRAPDLELRINRADDGRGRILLATLRSRRHPDSDVLTWFGTLQDISETKLQQRMLVEAKEQAERANQAKSEFLSRMSHELRTPLNAILGFSQLLEMDQGLSDKTRGNVAEIARAGNHLLELINEVLDLSHIESGRISLNLEDISVESIIEECIVFINPLARQRDIRITRSDSNFQDQPVFADRTRVRQVLLNLLSNAVKYNRYGGSIGIECSTSRGVVNITVSDTGPGIPEQKLNKLFVPFNRLGAEQTDVEGTGIGLVIARRLAEMMNGSLKVESSLGQGSAFTFVLPLSLGSEEYRDGTYVSPWQKEVARWQDVRIRIAAVEDSAANLRLLENVLSQYEGVKVASASDGRTGLAMIREMHPDIVILDINLPEMDGYEVLRHMRADPALAELPVIALSAKAGTADSQRGLQAGFNYYLTKPLDVTELMKALEELFARLPTGARTTVDVQKPRPY